MESNHRPAVYENQVNKTPLPHKPLPYQRKAKSRATINALLRCTELRYV